MELCGAVLAVPLRKTVVKEINWDFEKERELKPTSEHRKIPGDRP